MFNNSSTFDAKKKKKKNKHAINTEMETEVV